MKSEFDNTMFFTIVFIIGISVGVSAYDAVLKSSNPVKKHTRELVKYNKKHKAAFR